MPRLTVTSRLGALAAAVLLLGACSGDGDGDGGASDGAADADVRVEAGDLYFDPETLEAEAGEIEVALDNVGAVEHDFVVEEAGDTEVALAGPGELATGTIDLEPGSYTFYCSIPGHRQAMEGTLEVE